jgi:tRNA(Ile)-lysidine synthase
MDNLLLEAIQILKKDTYYILAVSGGIDSMVLLDVARKYLDISFLIVVTIDHQVRDTSQLDIELVQQYCVKHHIVCRAEQIEWKGDEKQTEAAMRSMRYEILESIQSEYSAAGIVVAHHLDDRIETMLFRMARGTGMYGLLSPRKVQGSLLRPLLNLPKQTLLDYAHKHAVPWREDETNVDQRYQRNMIRSEVMPHLGSIHPAFYTNMDQLVEDLEAWQAFHESYIVKWLESHPVPFLKSEFLLLPQIVQTELLQTLVRPHGVTLSRGHLAEALSIISGQAGGKKVILKKGIVVSVKEGRVWIGNLP